jgi:hypothetical protein
VPAPAARHGAAGAVLFRRASASRTQWFPNVLPPASGLNETVHRLLFRNAMAQEFTPADLSPSFRSNAPRNRHLVYAMAAGGFVAYACVEGKADRSTFSMTDLRALPERTQITRHDCVEGWSAIGKWRGVKLSALLDTVKPQPSARYVVFHCADPMEADGAKPYYESIDMDDAYHAQTILAYELNDQPLPIANGAPVRLRVERQLGYKQAKYIMRIELVESFAAIAGGNGGYWEDQGYEWYAGI